MTSQLLQPSPEKTLRQAKDELKAGMMSGAVCQCCGKYAKVKREAITRAMILALAWICKSSTHLHEDGWVDVQEQAPKWILRSNSHAKLLHWSLLERRDPATTAIKCSGVYRPTATGRLFAEGSIVVAKAVFIYNHRVIGKDPLTVSVEDCLGAPFDYESMVRRAV